MTSRSAEIIPLFDDGELAPVPEPTAVAALAEWNRVAALAGWPEARFLTASRRTAMRRALKDYGGLVGWKTHLERSAGSDFLTGKSWRDEKHRNWRPDLDWFLKPANVVKILEDKFSGKPIVTERSAPSQAINWRAHLEKYRKGGWWPSSFGPRPENPGPHLAPAEMVEAWRQRNNMTATAVPQETREQRLASSIASYRRIGQYDRANKLEEDLARLEKRSPVLVPAPDAPNPDLSPRPRPQTARTPPAGKFEAPASTVTDVPEAPPWDGDVPEGDPAMAEADD